MTWLETVRGLRGSSEPDVELFVWTIWALPTWINNLAQDRLDHLEQELQARALEMRLGHLS